MPNENDKPDLSKNELVTVLGGIEMEVTHKPLEAFDAEELKEIEKFKDILGTTQTARVRQIRARDIPNYHTALGNEEKCAELFCRKPKGWALTLENESFEKVMNTGQEINLPFWSAWFRRWQAQQKASAPGMVHLVKQLVADALKDVLPKGSASPGSSPT